MYNLIRLIALIVILTFTVSPVMAEKAKYFYKVASIAPDGSVWIEQFREFTKEVEEKTGGEVGFRMYAGGVMGDDIAMYRKVRAGQLHGGGFTMTGISTVVPDFRVMSLPFLFNSYAEVDEVTRGLTPHFKKEFSKKRLQYLAINEVGFVYAMSANPTKTVEELKKYKTWTPAGDPVSAEFLTTVGITPIQLSIPDVLSSLQTGLVDTVFNSLYGSIVLQWFTKAKYITDTPYGYAYGAFVMDKRAFSKMPVEYQNVVEQAAEKHFSILIDKTRQSNEDSRTVLLENGITFIQPEETAVAELKSFRDKAIEQLNGNAFSEDVYSNTLELLDNYRNQ